MKIGLGLLPICALLLSCSDRGPPAPSAPSSPVVTRPVTTPDRAPAPKWVELSDEQLRELSKDNKPFKPTDAQLREAIVKCRGLIRDHLKRSNDTPFEWIVLDEYAADVYMSMAPHSSDFRSANERIKQFRNEQWQSPTSLSLSFPVLRITDSFSGPQKQVESERCDMDSQLNVTYAP